MLRHVVLGMAIIAMLVTAKDMLTEEETSVRCANLIGVLWQATVIYYAWFSRLQ